MNTAAVQGLDDAARHDFTPFEGGPYTRFQTSLGLIRKHRPGIGRRVVSAVLIGWAPLAVLAGFQNLAWRDNPAESLLLDISLYSRFLIVVPLLIIAEVVCVPRMAEIARTFRSSGLLKDSDLARYEALVASTMRLYNSGTVELAIVGLAYAQILLFGGTFAFAEITEISTWRAPISAGTRALSLAGWWWALVSMPLYLILSHIWLWRLFLWGRFLWRMSRLDLELIPAHPDLSGGLKFVGASVSSFSTLSFALGVGVAGPVTHLVVFEGYSPFVFKPFVIALVVLALILFAGPLLVFTRNLQRAKWQGMIDYGELANGQGREFEREWLRPGAAADRRTPETPDFSSMADLCQIASNVFEMKPTLLDIKSVAGLILATLLPFFPVVLTVVPLREIVKGLMSLLL